VHHGVRFSSFCIGMGIDHVAMNQRYISDLDRMETALGAHLGDFITYRRTLALTRAIIVAFFCVDWIREDDMERLFLKRRC
jgi:hypothetical protein